MRLPTREIITLSVLTLVVAAVVSASHVARLARREVEVTQSMVRTANDLVMSALRQAAQSGREIDGDDGLDAVMTSSLAYTPGLLSLSVVDPERVVMASTTAGDKGRTAPDHPLLDDLIGAGPLSRVRTLLKTGEVYEERQEVVDADTDETYAFVVGRVDTSLVREELRGAVRSSLIVSLISLPIAWLAAFLVARATRTGIRRLSLRIDQIRHGELSPSDAGFLGAEFEGLAGQLGLLADEIKSERLALMSRADTLQSVMDHLRDAVLILDVDDNVVFYNRAFRAISGRDLADANGVEIEELLRPSHPLVRVIRAIELGGDAMEGVPCSIPGEERFRDAMVSGYPLHDGERDVGLLLMLEDVGTLKAVQSIVHYGARMAAMQRQTAEVVHDVKSPLNAMALNLSVLEREIDDPDPRITRTIGAIQRQIGSLDESVRGFLDYVRPCVVGDDAPILDLRELLEQLLELMREEMRDQGIALDVDVDGDEAMHVRGLESELRRAILNVLRNALEAMPGGGVMRVRLDRAPSDLVEMTFSDTGEGIPPDALARIFEYRFTTKVEGSGIGLFLVRRIVEAHGGTAEASPSDGGGVQFRIRLPLAPRPESTLPEVS